MTRVTGGTHRGRRLAAPTGNSTRPTGERAREALGNALVAAGGLEGAQVLDLYAGTGALGLELLSRGAGAAVLVERDRAALASLRTNVAALGLPATVVAGDVASFARHPSGPFDLVLADPPYEVSDTDLGAVLTDLVRAGALRPQADLIVERSARSGPFTWPDPLVRVRERRYGDTLLCYGRAP